MHRIDTSGNSGGQFQSSTPPATLVSPDWLNDVQENIVEVILAAGIELSKGDGSQLLDAINALIAAGGTPPLESIIVAVTGEAVAVAGGLAKLTFRMPYAFTLTGVRASLVAASSSGSVVIDINEGAGTVLSTKLSIDQGEKTSTTAASAAVISDAALADDAEITIDVDSAGTGAAGLKVVLLGRRA